MDCWMNGFMILELPQTPRQAFDALSGKRPDLLITGTRTIIAGYRCLNGDGTDVRFLTPTQCVILSDGKNNAMICPIGGFN